MTPREKLIYAWATHLIINHKEPNKELVAEGLRKIQSVVCPDMTHEESKKLYQELNDTRRDLVKILENFMSYE